MPHKPLQKKLSDGVAVISFTNIGSLYRDGRFSPYRAEGLFVVGYSFSYRVQYPIEKARKELQKAKDFGALRIVLTSLNRETKSFFVYGSEEELLTLGATLSETFASGTPLSIHLPTEAIKDLPYWWNRE